MAKKQDCAKNKIFNGNKYCGDPNKNANRFFCCFEQNRKKTGERLAKFRTEMNMTQQKFVDFLEDGGYLRISRTTLWKWESGNVKIGDEEIEALCVALKCRRDELVVYSTKDINDERDQLAHQTIVYFNIIDRYLYFQISVFFVNRQLPDFFFIPGTIDP